MRRPMGGGSIGSRTSAQAHRRSYSALQLRTLSCEGRDPMSRGRPQRGERAGAETIEQTPGDGEAGIADVIPRAAGDGQAWAAHPRPDDRPRPPAPPGVPVRGCAQVVCGGRGCGLSGSYIDAQTGPTYNVDYERAESTALRQPIVEGYLRQQWER